MIHEKMKSLNQKTFLPNIIGFGKIFLSVCLSVAKNLANRLTETVFYRSREDL